MEKLNSKNYYKGRKKKRKNFRGSKKKKKID
jgi:hypothetical protein